MITCQVNIDAERNPVLKSDQSDDDEFASTMFAPRRWRFCRLKVRDQNAIVTVDPENDASSKPDIAESKQFKAECGLLTDVFMEVIEMAMLKKKTRKAIRKTFKKVLNKHGPTVAQHMATGLAAGLATYLGAEGNHGRKQIKKIAKNIPGVKKIGRAIAGAVPALKGAAESLPGVNGHKSGGKKKRSKTSAAH